MYHEQVTLKTFIITKKYFYFDILNFLDQMK